jgi:hypothetical protein
MKKILMLMMTVVLLVLSGTGVLATSRPTALEWRAAAHEKALEVRENKLENRLIWAENVQLRTEIRLRVMAIREQEVVLEETLVSDIKALTETLKATYAELKATQGTIKAYSDEVKALIEARDWEGLETVYDQIVLIQVNRNALLEEINTLLTQLLALLPEIAN